MRLALVSDIHGNLLALEAVLADLKARAPDLVVNLGDCVTAPLWPRETLQLLDTLRWPTVRGNHDRWLGEPARVAGSRTIAFTHDALTAEQRARLGALPAQLEFDDILAVHGRPGDDAAYLLEDAVEDRLCLAPTETLARRLGATTASLVLCGHSHLQQAAWCGGEGRAGGAGRLVVNPGAVGGPRYADNAAPARNEAGSPHARYALATRRGAQWDVELIALAYDFEAVVARARANGRADWAAAFMK
jgi:predicted phosphodiesterase